MPHEPGQILLLDQAVLNELCAADDALKGRFQLMGYVGGKLPAALLRRLLLGDIKGQQHRPQDVGAGLDAGDVKLINAAQPLDTDLAVTGVHGGRQRVADVAAAVHRQEILAQAALAGAEHPAGGGVDAEHRAAFVQQHQPLLHVGGDLTELVGPAAQVRQLPVDLLALHIDAAQQRRQLLIGVVFQRVLQIQGIQRGGDPAGQTARQKARQHQGCGGGQQNGRQHSQHQHAHGSPADGNAQHRAVRHTLGIVAGLFQQGAGIAGGAAGAGAQGLPDLQAVAVVLQAFGVALGVAQHRAVGGDPGQAVAVRRELVQIVAALGFHRGGCQLQLILELGLLHGGKIAVQAGHDDDHPRQQHSHGGQHKRTENFLGHPCSSSR